MSFFEEEFFKKLRELLELSRSEQLDAFLGEGGFPAPPAYCRVAFRTETEARLAMVLFSRASDIAQALEYLEAENKHLKLILAGDVSELIRLKSEGTEQ